MKTLDERLSAKVKAAIRPFLLLDEDCLYQAFILAALDSAAPDPVLHEDLDKMGEWIADIRTDLTLLHLLMERKVKIPIAT